MSRYNAGVEDEYEPGSDGLVLRNGIGITDPERAGLVETALLTSVYRRVLQNVAPALVIDARLIRDLHREWLSPLYPFAGELRTVNVSKGGVLFAPVAYLSRGFEELDTVFRRLMPCVGLKPDDLSVSIAESHAEFIVLHPFREGNGRTGRLIADLMATQAGYGPLRWKLGEPEERARCFQAMNRGLLKDYAPLTALIREALRARSPQAAPP